MVLACPSNSMVISDNLLKSSGQRWKHFHMERVIWLSLMGSRIPMRDLCQVVVQPKKRKVKLVVWDEGIGSFKMLQESIALPDPRRQPLAVCLQSARGAH